MLSYERVPSSTRYAKTFPFQAIHNMNKGSNLPVQVYRVWTHLVNTPLPCFLPAALMHAHRVGRHLQDGYGFFSGVIHSQQAGALQGEQMGSMKTR
jgi:hypothetical protein